MMNPSDTLDPQIAQLLTKRPSQEQLMQYVSGEASPVLCEIIEAHMHRSPSVLMDIESLREFDREFDSALEQNHKQLESDPATIRIGDISARDSKELALAASSHEECPEVQYLDEVSGILSGLEGDASASPEAPSLCTSFNLAWKSSICEPPARIEVSWPKGKRYTQNWVWDEIGEEWRTNVVLPEPWSKTYVWLQNSQLHFLM